MKYWWWERRRWRGKVLLRDRSKGLGQWREEEPSVNRRVVIFLAKARWSLNKDTKSQCCWEMTAGFICFKTLGSNEDTSQSIYCEYRPQNEMGNLKGSCKWQRNTFIFVVMPSVFFYYPLRFIFLPHYSRNTKSSQKQGCKLKYDLYFFTFINLLIFKLIQYCSLVFEFFLQVHDHLHDHPASLQRFLNDTHLGWKRG